MKRRTGTPESSHPNNLLAHKRGGGLRRESPHSRSRIPAQERKVLTCEEYIEAYDYKTDPLILRDLLEELRQKHPEVSILKTPHYPLYSPHVKIYQLKKYKRFRRCPHE